MPSAWARAALSSEFQRAGAAGRERGANHTVGEHLTHFQRTFQNVFQIRPQRQSGHGLRVLRDTGHNAAAGLQCEHMDDSEVLAYKYFEHLGFSKDEVRFEPEGCKRFPDFLVQARIAVEVRSLNEQVASSGPKPLGQDDIDRKVSDRIQRGLKSLGPPKGGVSWYVDIEYGYGPAPDGRQVRKAIGQLRTFRDGPVQEPTTIRLAHNFALKLRRADQPHRYCFVMGEIDSEHSGVLVSSQLEPNIRICVDEKTRKAMDSGIARTKYAEWWLLLIDRVTFGEWVDVWIPSHGWWDKVILLNPRDPRMAIEVPTTKSSAASTAPGTC